MGLATAINVQPTGGGKAAITGDFVLIGSEVDPVIRALRDNGIVITALHSHMLTDTPRLFFMHYWANDDALKLAQGISSRSPIGVPIRRGDSGSNTTDPSAGHRARWCVHAVTGITWSLVAPAHSMLLRRYGLFAEQPPPRSLYVITYHPTIT